MPRPFVSTGRLSAVLTGFNSRTISTRALCTTRVAEKCECNFYQNCCRSLGKGRICMMVEQTSSPVEQDMTRERFSHIRICTMDDIGEANAQMNTFLATSGKRFCFCFRYSLECMKNPDSEFKKQYHKCPEKLKLTGLVIMDNKIVGMVKLHEHGLYVSGADSILHKTQPGEMYIEVMTVMDGYRGKGLGREMLEWAEHTARSRGAKILTLGVVNGNPATRLYERYGFVKKNSNCIEKILGDCTVTCFLGCPYSFGGTEMEKKLT